MTALVVESSVWAVAEQTGWLVLKVQPCPELRDWDGRVFCTRAAEPCSKCNDTRVVSPLVPADCLPHPCPYTGHEQHPRMCEQYTEPLPGLPGCGGSGTVAESFHVGPEGCGAALEGTCVPACPVEHCEKVNELRRQALLATAVITSQPIPVVKGSDAFPVTPYPYLAMGALAGYPMLCTAQMEWPTYQPALAGLVSPGDVVVRVELTPLEEPIVDTACRYCSGRGKALAGWIGDGTPYRSDCAPRQPLDLPLGVFTKEEQQ